MPNAKRRQDHDKGKVMLNKDNFPADVPGSTFTGKAPEALFDRLRERAHFIGLNNYAGVIVWKSVAMIISGVGLLWVACLEL